MTESRCKEHPGCLVETHRHAGGVSEFHRVGDRIIERLWIGPRRRGSWDLETTTAQGGQPIEPQRGLTVMVARCASDVKMALTNLDAGIWHARDRSPEGLADAMRLAGLDAPVDLVRRALKLLEKSGAVEGRDGCYFLAGKIPARHSPDFESVHWFGAHYTFPPDQAACVKVLWKAWENGTPEIRQESVLAAIDDVELRKTELRDLFKRNPAWGGMIQRGTRKGSFRLVQPD